VDIGAGKDIRFFFYRGSTELPSSGCPSQSITSSGQEGRSAFWLDSIF